MPSHFVSDIEIHVLCLICGVVCSEIDFVFHGLKSGIVGHLDRSLDSSDVRSRSRIGSSNYLAGSSNYLAVWGLYLVFCFLSYVSSQFISL